MAGRSIYTRELGAAVAREARSKRNVLHIISLLPDKWGVFSNAGMRKIKAFTTQRQAVTFAKKSAVDKLVEEIVVHTKLGQIKETITYPKNIQS